MRNAATVILFLVFASCADNAGLLQSKIDAATAEMDRAGGDSTKVITYHPRESAAYTLVFFPEGRSVYEGELIAKGVDPKIAKRIFLELSKFGVGERGRSLMVVAPKDKKPSVESYYSREIVYIDDIIIATDRTGDVELTLQKRGETFYLTSVR